MTVVERVNARALEPGMLPYAPELIVIDVSFISLTKVLPAVLACAAARYVAPEKFGAPSPRPEPIARRRSAR